MNKRDPSGVADPGWKVRKVNGCGEGVYREGG